MAIVNHECETLMPLELDDAEKGRLVVQYVRAHVRQRAADAAATLWAFCATCTIVLMFCTPFLVFMTLLLIAGLFGNHNPSTSATRRYPVG